MSARPFFVAAIRRQFSTNESGKKVDMLLFSVSYFPHKNLVLLLTFKSIKKIVRLNKGVLTDF